MASQQSASSSAVQEPPAAAQQLWVWVAGIDYQGGAIIPKTFPLYPQTSVTRCNVPSRNRHVYVYPRGRRSEYTRLWESNGGVHMSHTHRVRYIHVETWRYGGRMIPCDRLGEFVRGHRGEATHSSRALR
jgi:hypothetical protein